MADVIDYDLQLKRYACIGKIKHTSSQKARLALRKTKHTGTLVMYECEYCRYWHIGHEGEYYEN